MIELFNLEIKVTAYDGWEWVPPHDESIYEAVAVKKLPNSEVVTVSRVTAENENKAILRALEKIGV